jgi:hypothetical protein
MTNDDRNQLCDLIKQVVAKEARLSLRLAGARGSAAPDVAALQKWMNEVTQLLCFQADVPMQHKTDLCNALNEYNMVIEAQRLAQQNIGVGHKTDA